MTLTRQPSLKVIYDRPTYHLAPRQGWINDPNGPLFYKGVYHLFYQHLTEGCTWAFGLVWGHSISTDLVHWEHLPPALVPTPGTVDQNGCFSGCAVINTDGKPVILYTGVRLRSSEECGPLPPEECDLGLPFIECQCAAVPADPDDPRLEVWTKLETPWLPLPPPNMKLGGWRDPYIVSRPETSPDGKWTLLLGSGVKYTGGSVLMYKSKDLFSGWEFAGELCGTTDPDDGYVWECPLLVKLNFLPEQTSSSLKSQEPSGASVHAVALLPSIPEGLEQPVALADAAVKQSACSLDALLPTLEELCSCQPPALALSSSQKLANPFSQSLDNALLPDDAENCSQGKASASACSNSEPSTLLSSTSPFSIAAAAKRGVTADVPTSDCCVLPASNAQATSNGTVLEHQTAANVPDATDVGIMLENGTAEQASKASPFQSSAFLPAFDNLAFEPLQPASTAELPGAQTNSATGQQSTSSGSSRRSFEKHLSNGPSKGALSPFCSLAQLPSFSDLPQEPADAQTCLAGSADVHSRSSNTAQVQRATPSVKSCPAHLQHYQYFFCMSPDAPTNPSYYWLGNFVGDKFDVKAALGPFKLDLGDILYAPNTLVDDEGRVILWGWLQEKRKVGTYDYAGCMTVPRLLWLDLAIAPDSATTEQSASVAGSSINHSAQATSVSAATAQQRDCNTASITELAQDSPAAQPCSCGSSSQVSSCSSSTCPSCSNSPSCQEASSASARQLTEAGSSSHTEQHGSIHQPSAGTSATHSNSQSATTTIHLYQQPLPSLSDLRRTDRPWRCPPNTVLQSGLLLPLDTVSGPYLEIELEFRRGTEKVAAEPGSVGSQPAAASGVLLRAFQSGQEGNALLLYTWDTGVLEVIFEAVDPSTHEFSLTAPGARHVGGRLLRPPAADEALQLRIFLDYSLIEVFTGKGEALTCRCYRGAGDEPGIDLVSIGGSTLVTHAAAYEMSPITTEFNFPARPEPAVSLPIAIRAPSISRLASTDLFTPFGGSPTASVTPPHSISRVNSLAAVDAAILGLDIFPHTTPHITRPGSPIHVHLSGLLPTTSSPVPRTSLPGRFSASPPSYVSRCASTELNSHEKLGRAGSTKAVFDEEELLSMLAQHQLQLHDNRFGSRASAPANMKVAVE